MEALLLRASVFDFVHTVGSIKTDSFIVLERVDGFIPRARLQLITVRAKAADACNAASQLLCKFEEEYSLQSDSSHLRTEQADTCNTFELWISELAIVEAKFRELRFEIIERVLQDFDEINRHRKRLRDLLRLHRDAMEIESARSLNSAIIFQKELENKLRELLQLQHDAEKSCNVVAEQKDGILNKMITLKGKMAASLHVPSPSGTSQGYGNVSTTQQTDPGRSSLEDATPAGRRQEEEPRDAQIGAAAVFITASIGLFLGILTVDFKEKFKGKNKYVTTLGIGMILAAAVIGLSGAGSFGFLMGNSDRRRKLTTRSVYTALLVLSFLLVASAVFAIMDIVS